MHNNLCGIITHKLNKIYELKNKFYLHIIGNYQLAKKDEI